MTFSQSVKDELCTTKFPCEVCNFVFIYALVYFGSPLDSRVLFRTDKQELASFVAEKIVEDTGAIVTCTDTDINAKRKNKLFHVTIEDKGDHEAFWVRYHIPFSEFCRRNILSNECCRSAFLRGLFLACGTIVNPVREYHFEFKVQDESDARQLYELLRDFGHPFKLTRRKGSYILYLKENEQIEDILTHMGAVKCVFDLVNIIIEKELRNNVNRVTNCETANIQKTVTASMRQVEDIQYILKWRGKDYLPEDLRITALLRLDNPELSLKELCELHPVPISRSGLNHRLKRLSNLAEEIRKKSTG